MSDPSATLWAMILTAFPYLLAGLALGAALGALSVHVRHVAAMAALRADLRSTQAQATYAEQAQQRLGEQFRALSAEALARSSEQLIQLADARLGAAAAQATGELEQRRQAVEHLVAPLRETLSEVEGHLRELERARMSAYTALSEQMAFLRQTSEQLRGETSALVSALRAPQARGRWGEMQLRRVVEVAGMVEHCDFTEQVTVSTPDGVQRPDLVVRLGGGKHVVVDAKVTLAAYLEAAEATNDGVRAERLAAHARHLRAHVETLSAKSYWAAFSSAPEFVVLFVPGEAFLAPALEHDPALLEHAAARRVIIATPTTLITMLRTVAYSWQQAALTDNARTVFELGRELYGRLGKLGEHVDKLGRSLGSAVADYNRTVGSLESRVLVTARKLHDLHVVDGELAAPRSVDEAPRCITADDLGVANAEARTIRPLSRGDMW